MRELFVKEQLVDTDYDRYQLSYHIHQMNEEDCEFYGVSIFQYNNANDRNKLFDQAIIRGFSESLPETKAFFDMIFQETVFPVHLYSVADDWYNLQM